MNILITSIGSMSAQTVISSLKNNFDGKIIGCDIYPKEWLVNSNLVDVFVQVPKVADESYNDVILEICKREKVQYIIPLIDPEVDSFHKNIDYYNDIVICYPGEKSIEVGRDKYEIFRHFKNSKLINTIPTYKYEELYSVNENTPLILKPKLGRSSQGIFKFEKKSLLKKKDLDLNDYIIQPLFEGSVFTVDFIRDFMGNCYSVSREELLRTVNGAGLTVEIKLNPVLDSLVYEIGDKLDIKGCVNIEFIYHNEKYYLMDFNPRFSAGIGFSFLSGYDFATENLKVFLNRAIKTDEKISEGIYAKSYVDNRIN